MSKRDYYEVLGVPKNASDDDIRKAYRKLGMKYHPDRHSSADETVQKSMEEKFKEAKEAYECLSDPEKRQAYDQYGHAAVQDGHHASPSPSGTSFKDFFKDLAAEEATQKENVRQQKIKLKAAQQELSPLYDQLIEAHKIYQGFADGVKAISDDVRSPYRNVEHIEKSASARIEALKACAANYKDYLDEQKSRRDQIGKDITEQAARGVILQRVQVEHGDTLKALHRNILDLTDFRYRGFEAVVLERLSQKNTHIHDLIEKLDDQRPKGLSLLLSDNRITASQIDQRKTRLEKIVAQYRKIAPVMTELGYVGEGYNAAGRNGDVEKAIPAIVHEIEKLPGMIEKLNRDHITPPHFHPHDIFRDMSPFSPEYHEAEVNALLTKDQREFVRWAQTQIDLYNAHDTIDEEIVKRALAPESIAAAGKDLKKWKSYVDKARAATDPDTMQGDLKTQLKTGKAIEAALDHMNNLFTIDENCFEGRAGRFNMEATTQQYIQEAREAKRKIAPVLDKGILDIEDAISILRKINPDIVLTGPLKGVKPQVESSTSYEHHSYH